MTDAATGGPGRKLPVMADVARLAGVSHQTVSRVVNGRQNLRPETRERVLKAIQELGYRPNSAARALATRRSATIGVVGWRSGFWGPSTVQRAVQAAGRAAGYFVSSVDLRSLRREELLDAIEHLRNQSVEAIVMIGGTDDALEIARAQEDLGLPVVVIEGDQTKARWTAGVDQLAGAELGTSLLVELGHSHILHLAGPQSWTEARSRLAGWRRALASAGLRAPTPMVGDWTARSGYEAGLEIARRDDVSAVFCANDQMALGLLRALAERGRSVPGEISVVGFDDIPEAAYLIPPLTTVRQNFAAVGRRAIELTQAALAGKPGPERLIAPELVVRASSGLPGPQRGAVLA